MPQNQNELISVIVAIYNVEPYLPACLDSIRNQTYQNLDIILVDDGSTDGCPGICDAYGEMDDRIRVIHQANRGLSGARNTGIEHARGDIITFVDADDRLHLRFCEILYRHMEETGADVAVGNYDFIHRIDEEKPEQIWETDVFTKTGYEAQFLFYNSATCIRNGVAWLKLYRKRCFDEIRFPEGKIHEDTFVMPLIYDVAEKVVYTDAVIYYYLVRPDSITGRYHLKRLDQLEAQEQILGLYQKRGYQQLYAKAYESYLHNIRNHYFDVKRYFPQEKKVLRELNEKFRKRYKGERDVLLSRAARLEFDLFCLNKKLYQIVWKLWLKIKK
ncbi:MAG: glycosyltransferase family 2 protein [Lachnospiraceae bacterium]|nr:glycosyltransferase family 2 protein [Lachnospiraceae bacterium]